MIRAKVKFWCQRGSWFRQRCDLLQILHLVVNVVGRLVVTLEHRVEYDVEQLAVLVQNLLFIARLLSLLCALGQYLIDVGRQLVEAVLEYLSPLYL